MQLVAGSAVNSEPKFISMFSPGRAVRVHVRCVCIAFENSNIESLLLKSVDRCRSHTRRPPVGFIYREMCAHLLVARAEAKKSVGLCRSAVAPHSRHWFAPQSRVTRRYDERAQFDTSSSQHTQHPKG